METDPMIPRFAAMLGCALALAGCAIPAQRQGGLPVQQPSDPEPDSVLVNHASNLILADLDFNRPDRLIDDIDTCYRRDSTGPIRGYQQPRYCVLLDYTARKEWEARHRTMPRYTVPSYFENEAQMQRFQQNGPRANFNDPEQMYAYLRRIYAVVDATVIQEQTAQRGCVKGRRPYSEPENCLIYPYKIRDVHFAL
jgi:hypothetical protein